MFVFTHFRPASGMYRWVWLAMMMRLWVMHSQGIACAEGMEEADSFVARGLNQYESDEAFAALGFIDLGDESVEQTTFLQPTPFLPPRINVDSGSESNQASANLASAVIGSPEESRSLVRQSFSGVGNFEGDYIRGDEGLSNVATDVGSLLGKSSSALGTSVQKRTPIVNDPRIRSSRIGSLAASGSHWVPARIDLDTILSKFDSRQLSDVLVIPGPYSSRYGPGFQFVDFELARAPRYENGYETHGSSSFDCKSNGGQVFGQQTLLSGDSDWGVRASYAHRKGSDYRSGDGSQIASSYESREFSLAYGEDLGDGRSIEFSLLRLDQTDVEFPGYVFDLDFLVTDGYTFQYVDEHSTVGDRFETELWYNRTRLEGNAQSPAKRQQFPILGDGNYVGTTDVDSMSTGYRQGWSWGDAASSSLTLGHDLRFIKQQLNELATGFNSTLNAVDNNSPIPNSFSLNPGLYAEYQEQVFDDVACTVGGRLDFARTDTRDDGLNSQRIGLSNIQPTYAEVLGTDVYQQDFYLASCFTSVKRQITDEATSSLSLGYAERLPTLTDLYAAQPFLLVLQNGLNSVTGDPSLMKEKLLQCDLVFDYTGRRFNTGARLFHAWAFDYVTYENTGVNQDLSGQDAQVSLRTVNTDLATLAGFESFFDLNPNDRLTPFANIRYVDGRDRTRNGNFATREGQAGQPSIKDPTQNRGAFSGRGGPDAEPLPGISPLETRIGVRLRNDVVRERWNLELVARVLDNQDRVASSLLETATPGFTVWDLRGTFKPFEKHAATMVAGVENFTDKQYREHLDFRTASGQSVFQPGINFYLGADFQY